MYGESLILSPFYFINNTKLSEKIQSLVYAILYYPLSTTQQASTLVNEAISLFALITAFIQT